MYRAPFYGSKMGDSYSGAVTGDQSMYRKTEKTKMTLIVIETSGFDSFERVWPWRKIEMVR